MEHQSRGALRKAKTHVDKLTQSIFTKAFGGEVLQDPNDEPAEVLLETVRQESKDKTF